MTNGQKFINNLQANVSKDLLDKSSFTRYRAVEGGAIRVWHNGEFVCDSPAKRIAEVIDNRIEKGLSSKSDYKFV